MRRTPLALAAFFAAALASIATSPPRNWSLSDTRDLGPVEVPDDGGVIDRHLTASATAEVFSDFSSASLQVDVSHCPLNDAGFPTSCPVPDAGAYSLEIISDGSDSGVLFASAPAIGFGSVGALRCAPGPCTEGYTLRLRGDRLAPAKITFYRATLGVTGKSGLRPDGGVVTLTSP